MFSLALIDNDILLKSCCYGLIEKLAHLLAVRKLRPSILGVARFVVTKSLQKNNKIRDPVFANKQIDEFLHGVELIEPTLDEIYLAAVFEETAQSLNLPLDIGESQLLAIMLCRSAALLATGDKRAIKAIPAIAERHDKMGSLEAKFICFEQIMYSLLLDFGPEDLQPSVCKEPDLDITMGICFRCASSEFSGEVIAQSLLSYINNLRNSAGSLLINEQTF